MHCKTLANFIEDDIDVDTIPIPNVSSDLLTQIISYFDLRLQRVRTIADSEDTLDASQKEILRCYSQTLFQNNPTEDLMRLLEAANYLHCDVLIDVVCDEIVSRIKGKSTEEMRTILGIENDFTEEEEAQILEETSWVFH